MTARPSAEEEYEQLVEPLKRSLAFLKAEAIPTSHMRVADLDRLVGLVDALTSENAALREALETLRDCDWVISRGDRMDAVRDIARKALQPKEAEGE